MASANCARCLTRPSSIAPARITPIVNWSTSFSTNSSLNAAKPRVSIKPVQVIGKHIRRGKVGQNSKRKREIVQARKPGPGERKAFRKRIQLSNHNAAPIAGLPVVEGDALLDSGNLSKMVALPDKLVDQLRALEAFKTTQTWGLFRKPHMLVREETVQLMKRLKEAEAQKQTLKVVLTGEKNSGKSLTLLQAISHALVNEWVVIHIPEAQDLVNSNTEYSPVPNTSPIQFNQPVYCFNLLQHILKANGQVLSQIKAAKNYSDLQLVHFPKDGTLADLVASVKEADFAWPVLRALWDELTTIPGRPPMLVTVDGLSHIMNISAYRDPTFQRVHAHDLTLVRLLTDHLAGKTPSANGGAIIAATSRSNAPRSPSMELALSQREAAAAGEPIPQGEPYHGGYDDRVYESLLNVDVFKVGGVSKGEARAVMEYWARSGMFRAAINESTVTEKWTLGGHGILGEMERASLANMRL